MTSKEMLEVLSDAGFEARSYSGRGMYGANCVGVVTDNNFGLGYSIGLAMAEREIYGMPNACYDSMGVDTIVYWPDLAWPEGADSTDDEED